MRVVTLLPGGDRDRRGARRRRTTGRASPTNATTPRRSRHLPRVTATPIDPRAPGRRHRRRGAAPARCGAARHRGRAPSAARLAPDLDHHPGTLRGLRRGRRRGAPAGPALIRRLAGARAHRARRWTGSWRTSGRSARALELDAEGDELVDGDLGADSRGSARAARAPAAGRSASSGWSRSTWPATGCPSWSRPPADWTWAREPGAHSAGDARGPTRRALRPTCIVVMLCGFGVDRAERELDALTRLRRPAGCSQSPGLGARRQCLHLPARARGSWTAPSGSRRRCAARSEPASRRWTCPCAVTS